MKKAEVNKIKKVINQDKHYTTYYKSKTEELRIMVYGYGDCGSKYDEAKEKESIINLLNKLSSNGLRPRFRIDRLTYQGFLHYTYVVIY